MSNNMYDILGKLSDLTPKEQPAQPAKPLYESVEAKGSIVAGVKSVEQKLREQYESLKNEERETLKTKQGTIYKGGTYGNADYDSEAGGASNAPKPTRGRPAAGKERIAKVAKVRGPKGRPKKNANGPTGGSAPKGDIFGRTTGSVPAGKKGTVIKGKANQDTVDEGSKGLKNPFSTAMGQAKKEIGLGRAKQLGESISLGGNPSTLQHIISKYKYEVKSFINDGELDHDLYEALFDYYFDAGEMPYGTAKGRTGDPYEWISQRFDQDVHDHVVDEAAPRGPSFAPQHPGTPAPKPGFLDKAKAFGHKALNTLGHGSDDELRQDLARKAGVGALPNRYNEEAELNELAKLAGLQVSEAAKPDFTDVDKDGDEKESWKKAEKDKQEVEEATSPKADKDYDKDGEVESEKDEVIGSRRKAAGLDECMSPIAGGASEMHSAEQQQGRISVNTNSSSDGNKNVTISADGEAAEQLMQMLKMAGLGGGQAHAQQAEIVIAHEAKEYGNTDVEEPEEYVNSPREKVATMRQSPTTGMAGGTNDLNKSKAQDPATANKAANPKTKVQNQVEDVNPLEGLGAKLMAEYQSIKIQK